MPRQSRRPAPRPAPKPMAQQTRPSTTAAAPARSAPVPQPPPAAAAPPAAASQGPGLFGQMASTAAGVAVGSSIGHAVGSMFGGGSSGASDPTQASTPEAAVAQTQSTPASAYGNCAPVFNMFSQCMEQNNNDGNACQWYWQQLKSCQEAQNQ